MLGSRFGIKLRARNGNLAHQLLGQCIPGWGNPSRHPFCRTRSQVVPPEVPVNTDRCKRGSLDWYRRRRSYDLVNFADRNRTAALDPANGNIYSETGGGGFL